MRLLVYNIRYGTGAGPGYHLPLPFAGALRKSGPNFNQIRQFIRKESPDLAVLLEADRGSYRSLGRCQATEVASAIQGAPFFAGKYGLNSLAQSLPVLKAQGNAVISRLPVQGKELYDLGKGIKRIALRLQLEQMTLLAVHLPLGSRARKLQLEKLAQIVQSCRGPLILSGDFNTLRGDEELRDFLDRTGLISANRWGHPTYPAKRPFWELDYILHSPDIRSLGLRIPPVSYSDHRPIIWDFELAQQAHP